METLAFLIVGVITSFAGDYTSFLARRLERLTPYQRFWFYAALSMTYSAAYAIGMDLWLRKPASWQDVLSTIVNALVIWTGSQGAKNVWRIILTQRSIQRLWPDNDAPQDNEP